MAKASKAQLKNKYVFNFSVYKERADLLKKRLQVLTKEQIRSIQELESQAYLCLQDDKSCILPETPSQQRRRMFPAGDMIASSPLREGDPPKPSFLSVIRMQGCERLTHFEDDVIKQKLCFDPEEEEGGGGSDALSSTESAAPQKRKLRANPSRCPPGKISVMKRPDVSSVASSTRSKRGLNGKNAILSNKTSQMLASTKNLLEEKKERARQHAAEVEMRRKAANEERLKKIEQRAREESEKEVARRKRLGIRQQNIEKSSQTTIMNPSTTKSTLKTPARAAPVLLDMNTKPVVSSSKTAINHHHNISTLATPFSKQKVDMLQTSKPLQTLVDAKSCVPPTPLLSINELESTQNKENNHYHRRETFLVVKNATPLRADTLQSDFKSYNITPECVAPPKPHAPPLDDTYNCYDIAGLLSDDSTDDEKAPSKPIPKWAQDKFLWRAVVSQNKDIPINGEEVFGPIPPVDMAPIFANPSDRFARRTSSAHWESNYLEEPACI